MKTLYILKGLACCMLASYTLTGCEDAENDTIDNLVYFTEASTDKTKEITLQEGTSTTTLTVRLAQAATQDVQVTLALDAAKLEAYNTKNETAYQCIDARYVSFPTQVTIAAGSVVSDPVELEIQNFDTQGVQYAVPLSIASTTGVEKTQVSSSFIVVLVKPIVQMVPKFQYGNGIEIGGEWGLELPNVTFEWWSRVTGMRNAANGYSVNNQALLWAGDPSTNSFYPRFGDVVYVSNGKYVYNFLQVKAMGSQFDTGDPSTGNGLESGKWYHFAYTYDAASGTSLLYKDGVQVATLSTTKGVNCHIDCFQLLCGGADYWKDYIEMCQVRLWKCTRTAAQIKKGMYSEVEYSHPDLLLYLPMNEGPQEDGSNPVLKDVSGHGRDAVIGSLSGADPGIIVPWETYTFAQ